MSYKIKQKPEDFIVEEIPLLKDEGKGDYTYFTLEKTGLNTLQAAELIAAKLGISIKQIGWAGNKDKHAITTQLISLNKAQPEKAQNLNISGIKLSYAGRGTEAVAVGKLKANKFTITLRNLAESDCAQILKNAARLKKNSYSMPNYFDEQRFSAKNPELGRMIVQGKINEAIKKFPEENLRRMHKSQLLLYVHAYQSLLFNRMLASHIKKHSRNHSAVKYSRGEMLFPAQKMPNCKIPIIGFGTETTKGEISELMLEEMKAEGITPRNFIIRQLPEATSEGSLRAAFVSIKNLEIGCVEQDELNEGAKKSKISFTLPKGSYATIAVKMLACQGQPK